jgi:hypothetical protein
MKKFTYLLLLIVLFSCSKHKEVKEENIPIIVWNTIENDFENEKIDQIKNLLKDNKNIEPIIETWAQNNIQKNESPIKIKDKTPIITPINKTIKSKTSILTEEELNIIENTTDWEIDKLIDILFKDLN